MKLQEVYFHFHCIINICLQTAMESAYHEHKKTIIAVFNALNEKTKFLVKRLPLFATWTHFSTSDLIFWVHQRSLCNITNVRKLPKKSGDESSNFTSQNEWVPFHSCFYRTWTSSSVTKSFAFVRVKTYFTNLCHFRTRSVDKAFAKWYATLTHFCYLFNIDLYTVQCTRTGTTHRYRLTLTCTPNHTATCTKHGTINVILSNAFTLDGSVFQRIIFRFPESFHRVNSSPFDFFECE